MRTLAAFTIASAASIIATRPRVSIIPNASPIRPPGLTLRQHAARAQGFIHQRDQFLARDLEPFRLWLHVFGYHRTTGFDISPRLYAVPGPRIKQFINLFLGEDLWTAQKLGHQRDPREMLYGFHLEKSLVYFFAVAHAAVVSHQHGIVLGDVRQHAFGQGG